jgi:hypothetical protein
MDLPCAFLSGWPTGNGRRASALPGDVVGGGEHLAADGLELDLGAQQPGRHPLDHPPLPDRGGVEAAPCGQPPLPPVRVTVQELNGVLAHEDPQVVLGLGPAPAASALLRTTAETPGGGAGALTRQS